MSKVPKTRIEELIHKYYEKGIVAFSQEEVIELFLSYASGLNNMENLINEMYSNEWFNIFDLASDELRSRGINESGVYFTTIFPQIANRCLNCVHEKDFLNNYGSSISPQEKNAIQSAIFMKFIGIKHEQVLLILFDKTRSIIDMKFVSDGNGFCTSIDSQRICCEASSKGAHYVILAHNHPSGSFVPSFSDISATLALSELLNSLGIMLVDHFIVTRSGCKSIKEFYKSQSSS